MKRLLLIVPIALLGLTMSEVGTALTWMLSGALAAIAGVAMAHGPHGGYRGHTSVYYGGYGNNFWGPALVGGAIVGTSIYLSRPVQPSTVIITRPPTVVVTNPQPTQWVNSQPVQIHQRCVNSRNKSMKSKINYVDAIRVMFQPIE